MKETLLPRQSPRKVWCGQPELIGFFVSEDDKSLRSLRDNLDRLDRLIPDWLYVTRSDGTLTVNDPKQQKLVTQYIRQRRPGLPILPLLSNFDSRTMRKDPANVREMLADPTTRRRIIGNLLEYLRSNGFAGVCVSLEPIGKSGQTVLLAFMSELYETFNSLGLEVCRTVPLDTPLLIDYRSAAKVSDYLILTAHDEHSVQRGAGPVVSQERFALGLQRRFSELPPEKLVVSIGNLGCDWTLSDREAKVLSFPEVLQIAQETKAEIRFDPDSLNPTFGYHDTAGRMHRVWFLDAVTAFNQILVAQRRHLRGFALWRLGSEDCSAWSILASRARLGGSAIKYLQTLIPGYEIHYKGEGDVLRIQAEKKGRREIAFDKDSGLVTMARVVSYPAPYQVIRKGNGDGRKIALTFDDGPHWINTPQVLDTLRRCSVPATFFMIGQNVLKYPKIARRVIKEGHEIGNHTLTHPRVSAIPFWLARMEINATQRLFEIELAIRSLLFRSPFGFETDPSTMDCVRPFPPICRLGYYIVGGDMSVEDWRKPGVDRIISGTIDAVLKGNRSIVILHDGGADRSQTVAALPKIIEELRARNFEFVPVSDLMGIPQAAIMPPVSYGDGILRRLGKFGFLASTCLYIVGVRLLTIIRNHFRREPDGMRARSQAGV